MKFHENNSGKLNARILKEAQVNEIRLFYDKKIYNKIGKYHRKTRLFGSVCCIALSAGNCVLTNQTGNMAIVVRFPAGAGGRFFVCKFLLRLGRVGQGLRQRGFFV